LSSNARLDKSTQIACIPSNDTDSLKSNIDAWVTGWGTTSYMGSASQYLKNVKITILEPTACDTVASSTEKDWNAQICAGDVNGGKDSCQGDSGGGLYVYDTFNDKKKYIAVGVVSYGDSCGLANSPG
jgi:secreted trypsin-like serine protease